MSSMHDITRHANVMTATERDDLIAGGWPVEVIDSLRVRGFRPCKPDIVSARFEGDARDCIGFLRQTTLPHIQITLERSQDVTSPSWKPSTARFVTTDARWAWMKPPAPSCSS
jgi:hypothetical protein